MQRTLGRLGAAMIRLWLRVVGRTVERSAVPCLDGPIGPDVASTATTETAAAAS